MRGAGAIAVLCAPFVCAPGPRPFYGEADARERVLLSDGGGREKLSVVVVWDFTSRVLRFRVLVGYMRDGSRRQTPAETHFITGHRSNFTTITSETQRPAGPPPTPTPAVPTPRMHSYDHTMMLDQAMHQQLTLTKPRARATLGPKHMPRACAIA